VPRTSPIPTESLDYFMGCDPGTSGSIMILHRSGKIHSEIRWDWTLAEIGSAIRKARKHICFALVEQVGAMPTDARSSAFKFGNAFGCMRGMISVCGIRHEYIRPQDWQGKMSCRSKGNKNITKARAQQLFPDYKITHRNADALLLAELARRTALERGW